MRHFNSPFRMFSLFLFVALSFGVGRAADESAAAPAAPPAKVQSAAGAPPVNGFYTGWAPLPEMKGEDTSEWFRLHRLSINGKVVELSGEPVVIKDGELLFSASDGGFITYKGEIYEKEGKLRIRLRFVDRVVCAARVVALVSRTEPEIGDTIALMPWKNGSPQLRKIPPVVGDILVKRREISGGHNGFRSAALGKNSNSMDAFPPPARMFP